MWDSGYYGEDADYTQDEWLITPNVKNAEYLDFYCFINPMVLEYAQYEEFTDHYYVKVSHDNGATWEVVWDACYDALPVEGYQQVSIPLGSGHENTMVAFEAMGDQESGYPMYFSWAIDDVTISSSAAQAAQARAEMALKPRADMSGLVTYRPFTPENPVRKPAKVQAKVAHTPTLGYYKLYYDGELMADNLMTLSYVDGANKDAGKHAYKVTYFDTATNTESEGVSLEVNIDELPFNPPTNLRLSYVYDEEAGSYETIIQWDEPEGGRKPAFYNVYRDGQQIAYEYPECSISQTMMPRGVFVYSVSADYEYPFGTSEEVSDILAVDTRYPVMNLKSTVNGSDVELSWEAPKTDPDHAFAKYAVYRGNTLLSNSVTDLKYTDTKVADGVYEYSVVAVYADDVCSPGETVNITIGEAPVLPLPLSEDFSGGMTPENWTVYTETSLRKSYRWCFDNFYELPVNGGGFDGDFASINSTHTGYNYINCELHTPYFSTVLAEGDRLFLSFDIDYQANNPNAEIMEFDGTTSITLDELPSYKKSDLADGETCRPQHVEYELTDFINGDKMMIVWAYETMADGHLAIDNVKIYAAAESQGVNDIANSAEMIMQHGNTLTAVSENGIRDFVITSLDGKVVAGKSGNNSTSLEISTENIPSGLYIARMVTEKGVTAKKVLVK